MTTAEVIIAIIKEQSQIVGDSLAKQMAVDSGVVTFKSSKVDDIDLSSEEPGVALPKLIESYGRLFGPASIEVCKGIVRKYYGSDAMSLLQSI